VAQVEGLAARQPVLILFEDAQWSDPTSLELFDLIIDRAPALSLLVIITYRPEFTPPWTGRPHVSLLSLNRLASRLRAEMIAGVTGGKALPQEIADQIMDRTDGVPLFVKELTKAVVESGMLTDAGERYTATGPLTPLAIPASLQASLLARLDRLAPVREVAQLGAALGRRFSHELIGAVLAMPQRQLEDALAQLVRAELIYRRGTPPDAEYTFKHALVQDAAYSTLLRNQRQSMHARIASALEERFPDTIERQPELLAHHYTQAGIVDRAIDYWRKAGERALRRSAMLEAVQHLTHAIEITRSLPASPERDRGELNLHLALGRTMRIVKGIAAPETLSEFARARDLLDNKSATMTEQMTVLYGLWGVHWVRAENDAAHEVARQCLTLATQNKGDKAAGALANYIMGDTLWATGNFLEARDHLERTIHLSASTTEGKSALRFSDHHDIVALSFLSWALWPLGYAEQAVAAARQAVMRAREIGHVPLTAFVLYVDVFLETAFGAEREPLVPYADDAAAYCIERGVKTYELWIRFCQGLASARRDGPRRAIDVMRGAIEALTKINAEILRTVYLGHLAAAHAGLGELEVALALADEALRLVEGTGERLFEAELYRLRGEFFLISGNEGRGETALEQALTVARRQQARMWELRAAASLARLRRDQGRRAEARGILAPVYGWFTEGFATKDLKEARALLEELA
jgi:predicted ATPase